MSGFTVTDEVIDTQALQRELSNDRAGAFVSFGGWVRNHNEGRLVLRLEYEVHKDLAISEAAQILAEARSRYDILDLAAAHRAGVLEIGECSVWVGVISVHRGEAFDACRYVIDEIKHRLPIWKKEYYADGDAEWVNCSHCEKAAQDRHGNA